jgi:photosystem II stability/assembly factor-like uncharacterized protein
MKLKILSVLAILTIFFLCMAAAADETEKPAAEKSHDILENIKFRNLGPAVGGGRVSAVAGVPGQANIYYAGGAAGGVFKTIDGGLSWKPIFEKEASASIGAIAVAPSNPSLIWVGTGEANPRNDMVTGHGVYFSPDAGASWRFMGLDNVGQISTIVVHPTNPDVVFVAALGRVWGSGPDRGVYRTIDGGKTWQKVLYVNEQTGASDLVMDPANPMILFAGMWEVRRYPWMLLNGGNGSAIYRSTDGGSAWKKLSEGLPKPPLGRIGLAIAASNPQHVYALVDAKKGVLWDTTDLGDHWKEVSNNRMINARPFYFSRVFVAPNEENHLYFLSFDIVESQDGGKTAKVIGKGVHPDQHALWIDPAHPERMIEGNDGGVYISADSGKNWRYLDNIPIEQFYQVATSEHEPYLICGGLQDNFGWCGPSSSLSRDGVVGADWFVTVLGDGEYVVPAPGKSDFIYGDSQGGHIRRLDSKSGMSLFARPYLPGVGQMPPSELKYRFNWTSPIAVSSTDPNEVYLGGNVLFKSADGAMTWTPISPDLTRNDKNKQAQSGGPVELDLSGAETFDTLLSIAISPVDSKVIWVGTDDGIVQMTRDGGENWTKVSAAMPALQEWGRIQQIEASPFSADTCYVAVDLHELDNDKPYVFRTHDFGKTWIAITKGLPASDPARVVREDPNRRGFLVTGTDTGLFYSDNDGDEWKPLKSNFPTVPIYDLKFVKKTRDLVVGTHGRGVFVLDNLTALEEMTPETAASDFHLFSVQPAHRWHLWNKRGFSQAGFSAPDAPRGAVIDYFLKSEIEVPPEMKEKHETPVKIVISDADGKWVKTFYGPSKAGFNRAGWDLRYQEPVRLSVLPPPEPNIFFETNLGPPVVPGTYQVSVTVNGKTEAQRVDVATDPRFPADMEAFRAQTKMALEVRDQLSDLAEALNRLDSLKSQIGVMKKLLTADETSGRVVPAGFAPVLEQAKEVEKKVKALQERAYNVESQGPDAKDYIRFTQKLHDRYQDLLRGIMMDYDRAPSALLQEEHASLYKELQAFLGDFNGLLNTDVSGFNKLAAENGAGALFTGAPIQLAGEPGKNKGE